MIFVDGMEVGDIEDVALRDRRMLSADGIFIVVATDLGAGRPLGRAARDHLPRRAVRRRGRRLRRRAARWRWTSRSARSAEEEITRDRPAPGPPARRRGRVRLRPPAAAADGPAGGRRGLAAARRPACPVKHAAGAGGVGDQRDQAGERLAAGRHPGEDRGATRSRAGCREVVTTAKGCAPSPESRTGKFTSSLPARGVVLGRLDGAAGPAVAVPCRYAGGASA